MFITSSISTQAGIAEDTADDIRLQFCSAESLASQAAGRPINLPRADRMAQIMTSFKFREMTFPGTLTSNGDELQNVAIAVMGATGSGKTSFVNLMAGTDLQIGGELESCTTTVQLSNPFVLDGYRITLIDTPGFDDLQLKDSDVLSMIAAHLAFAHKQGTVLAGVIYMHRISDNRMGGIAARNFRMFRHLCGDTSLQNVLIVTTMWNQVDQFLGEAREKELGSKNVFYKPALEKGAKLARHDGTEESGQSLLRTLIQTRPQSLQIQRELDAGMNLAETSAGKQLNSDILGQISQHRDDIQKLVAELNEASRLRDEITRKELAEDRGRLEAEIRRLQADSKNMATGYAEAMAKLEQKVKDMEKGGDYPAEKNIQLCDPENPKRRIEGSTDNAVLEAKLGGAFPIFGFWGKMAVMLSPFSLSWK